MKFFKHPANAIPPIVAAIVFCTWLLYSSNAKLLRENANLREINAQLMDICKGYNNGIRDFVARNPLPKRAPIIEEDTGDDEGK